MRIENFNLGLFSSQEAQDADRFLPPASSPVVPTPTKKKGALPQLRTLSPAATGGLLRTSEGRPVCTSCELTIRHRRPSSPARKTSKDQMKEGGGRGTHASHVSCFFTSWWRWCRCFLVALEEARRHCCVRNARSPLRSVLDWIADRRTWGANSNWNDIRH